MTEDVRARARRGAWMLLWRLGVVQALSLGTGILLARWLGPEPFGTLAVAQALAIVYAFVGDLGLGAALIQRQDAVEEGHLRAAFTVQVATGASLGAAVLVVGPVFEALVWKTSLASAVLPAVVASSVIAPYRAIAVVRLERDLRFARIAAIETAEHAVYCGVALALAYEGWGVASLAGAILSRTVTGCILAATLGRWSPRFTTQVGAVKPLLDFGIARQTQLIVFHAASLCAPVVVGRWAGQELLGLVLWAVGNAERPKPILEIIDRVAFPFYARSGATPETLRAGVDRTLHGGLLAACLYGGLLAGVAPILVPLLYTATWAPAIPYLYVFIAIFPLVTTTILLDVAFLASGGARVVRNVHVIRLVLSWALAVPATRQFGVAGYLAAHATAITLFTCSELWLARSFAPLSFLGRVARGPILAGLLAAVTARLVLRAPGIPALAALVLAVAAGTALFAAAEVALDRARLSATVRLLTGRS